MKTLASLLVGVIFIFPLKAQQGFVVDHNHTDLSQIPDQWTDAAKSNLKIRYFRRSHGSHIDVGGMAALRRYSPAYADKYNYNTTGVGGALKLSTQWMSLDFEPTVWYSETRSYLDSPENEDINVVMWAWSSKFFSSGVQAYIDTMETFIAEYGLGGSKIISGERTVPVTFVFQTACGQESNSEPDSINKKVYVGNSLIRNHCSANNRVLFDFNDLESYDPDGNYYGDIDINGNYTSIRELGDDLSYHSDSTSVSWNGVRGNWGIEWRNRNPASELTLLSADDICTVCEHSDRRESTQEDNSRLHCVLKGQAAWWLWARLAGWQQVASLAITSTNQLSETNLNNAVVTINLSGDTFADDTLQVSNFQLNSVPPGTSIQSITYANSQQAQVVLAFDGTDFDIDYAFSVTILDTELQGNIDLTSNTLNIEAINEDAPLLQISSSSSLSENNLDGAIIHLELSNETFVDDNLESLNFELLNEPAGCTISSITYITDTTCNIQLSFNNTDFDVDITNFGIEVAATELTGNENLQSNTLNINAIVEEAPSLQITSNVALSENTLNEAIIHLELSNERFANDNLETQNFELLNEPAGCAISSITYNTETTCGIQLSFNNTDFDTDITNFRIEIAAVELSGSENLQSNALSIDAIDEDGPLATLSSGEDLIESKLNGFTLYLSLSNESFDTGGRSGGEFVLQNEPVGLSIDTAIITSDSEAEITLAFDGTDFTENILDFRVLVANEMLAGNADLASNALTIHADIAQVITTNELSKSIKLYPNPGDGRFSIELDEDFTSKILVKIIDMDGKCVYEKLVQSFANKKIDFNLQNLKTGSYFLVLNSNKSRFVKTFIIE